MNRRLTQVVDFLESHPGYIKWGSRKLAEKLGVSRDEIKAVKKFLGVNTNSKADYEQFVADCKEAGIVPIEHIVEEEEIDTTIQLPKILILDIETAPVKAYVWRLWKQDVYIDQIISDWFMLTWSAKWLGADGTMSEKLTTKEALEEDDKRIVTELWDLLNEADIVIAHNGNSFDIPKIKTRFILHGLPPTTPYQQIDTKVIAAKEFGFSSNKLDYLGQMFGLGQKIHTEFSLWTKCLQGDPAALEEMRIYNVQDVILLEKIYLKLRPYIKGHPNVTLYDERYPDRCPSCGGSHLVEVAHTYTSVNKFKVFSCLDCGAMSRNRKSVKRVKATTVSLSR